MLRVTVPDVPGGYRVCLVIDEASGAYEHDIVVEKITATAEDEVWTDLEEKLASKVQADIAKGPQTYAGLRGTILLGSTKLIGDRLHLRSLTDVMTVDYELAIVLRKALNRYLEEAPADMELVELTPYCSYAHYGPDGVTLTVRRGRISRSRDFNLSDIGMYLATEEQVQAQVDKLVNELDQYGPDGNDVVPALAA